MAAPPQKKQLSAKEPTSLTREESREFERLDEIVASGLRSIVDAAVALETIRDQRLYREKFPTFEEYCQKHLDLTRQYANRLIRAGKVRLEMETIVSSKVLELADLPQSESVLYELRRVDGAEEKCQVYSEAMMDAGDAPPTAAQVREVIDRTYGVSPQPKPARVAHGNRAQRAIDCLDKYEDDVKTGKMTPSAFIKALRRALSNGVKEKV